MKFILFVIILKLFNLVPFIQTLSFSTYELIIDYLDLPESRQDKLFNYGTLRVKKYNRTTYAVDGYFEVLRDLTPDIMLSFELYTLQGNEYRRTSDRKNVTDECTTSLIYKHHFVKYLQKYTNISPNYSCPFPRGRYYVNNAAFSNEYMPVEPMRAEKFRINITHFMGDEIISTYAVYYVLKKHPPGFGLKN